MYSSSTSRLYLTAKCSAVNPFFVTRDESDPESIRIEQIFLNPSLAAWCNAFIEFIAIYWDISMFNRISQKNGLFEIG